MKELKNEIHTIWAFMDRTGLTPAPSQCFDLFLSHLNPVENLIIVTKKFTNHNPQVIISLPQLHLNLTSMLSARVCKQPLFGYFRSKTPQTQELLRLFLSGCEQNKSIHEYLKTIKSQRCNRQTLLKCCQKKSELKQTTFAAL